jgi:hypothetical protein
MERLVNRLGDVARILDQNGVLDDRHRDAGDVGLLEAVRADELGAHLAGEKDGGHAVHDRVGDAGHQVGGPGTAGGEGHADLPRGLRIPLGRMSRALLVTALDVANAGVIQSVVGRQVRAAGNSEYVLDALRLEAFHDGVDGSHDGCGPSLMGGETPAR